MQQDQPRGIVVGQRAQQDGVDHREGRRRGADRERQRGDHDETEHRRALQAARAVLDVLPQSHHQNLLRDGMRWLVPGPAVSATGIKAQQDRSADRVGDQPCPCVWHAEATEPPALARQALETRGLQRILLTQAQLSRIRANEQPNQRRRSWSHRIRLSEVSCGERRRRSPRAAALRRRRRGARPR